jgi:hypothetical protein
MVFGQHSIRTMYQLIQPFHLLIPVAYSTSAVAMTDSFDIANIVAHERNQEMHPIFRRNAAIREMLPSQNFLANQRYHNGVIQIMIKRISVLAIFSRAM